MIRRLSGSLLSCQGENKQTRHPLDRQAIASKHKGAACRQAFLGFGVLGIRRSWTSRSRRRDPSALREPPPRSFSEECQRALRTKKAAKTPPHRYFTELPTTIISFWDLRSKYRNEKSGDS